MFRFVLFVFLAVVLNACAARHENAAAFSAENNLSWSMTTESEETGSFRQCPRFAASMKSIEDRLGYGG